MDFLTVLSYFLAILETAALIGALIYVSRALSEKKRQRKVKGKKGYTSNDVAQKAISAAYRNAAIFFCIYLILNFLRLHSGIFA